ncbi:MAG: N-carbamoylputrescine amidase [Thermoleophilaceae bacterium]|jgi:predicted amidohydrolase|nr:N-carbamoylputrescine amidase [Thermoleophilaceae bacterium]
MREPTGKRIAAVAAGFGRDLDTAFVTIERAVEDARERGAGLVVFPECSLGGYIREPEGDEVGPDLPPALDPDGPEIARLIRLAADTVICIGYTEGGPGGPYSSAVCVSGDGVLGRHRKVHLPPAERFAYTAGTGFAAFDTPVGRIGMLLCYDKLFPEAARALALDGADTIACMAAWPVDRRRPARRMAADRQTRHFDLLDCARAVENQVVWVSTNQAGPWGPLRFLGRAKIVDPDGVVIAETGHRGGVAVAEIDAALAVEEARLDIDHLSDRRPAAYLSEPALAEPALADVLLSDGGSNPHLTLL